MIAEYLRARYAHAPHGHDDPIDGIVMLQLERRPPWVDLEEDERDDWFRETTTSPANGGIEPMTTARLFLSGIAASGHHGARPGEKDEPQDFVVDLDSRSRSAPTRSRRRRTTGV